ncbi:cell surface metalloreductase [Apiospora phragmitis]|uniref:Cell surface metalloreductase n=1 Tax=Apiospora phragmitis TaxID=2905665 RepID=A0ABR1SVK8_9PEZI
MPVLLGLNLSFLADRLGITLKACHKVHSTFGLVSFGHLLLHVVVIVAERGSFSWHVTQELFAMIGTLSLSLLVCLSISPFRRRFYEVFIRTHQILALALVLGLWQHLGSFSAFRWLLIYIYCGVFFGLHLLQAGLVLYRNVVWGKPLPRAVITQHNGAIRIQLRVSRSVKVDAGQYIGLWIPAVSLGSLFQVHPFMVTSWAEIEQDSLELFVQPRRGITSKLLRGATLDAGGASSRIALFSGPHGQGLPVWDFETVLLVATGFGIAAMLPYLRKLIRGYNLSKGQLVSAAGDLLNDALSDDTLGDGYILCISIYHASGSQTQEYGKHARATLLPGVPQWEEILQSEIQGDFLMPEIERILHGKADDDFFRRLQKFEREKGRVLVIVSAKCEVRDELRCLVRQYILDRVQLQELDYQPV